MKSPMNSPCAMDLPDTPASDLRSRLLQRVHSSHAHERQFHTVRRERDDWRADAPGLRRRPLAAIAAAASWIVELAPGAALPRSHEHAQLELVLLDGQACIGATTLDRGDAVCAPHDDDHAVRAGAAGARFYLRLSAPERAATQLLRFSTVHGEDGWADFVPGVRIRGLWDGGERQSVLVRMAAGATIKDHDHGLDEECMMLAGEAFLGDTLMRGGDYQLSPKGSRHGVHFSDVGALFYVHGALDPAAYV